MKTREGKAVLPKLLEHCPACRQLTGSRWGMVGQDRATMTCPKCFLQEHLT